jgi:hypothetical protein
VGIKRGEFTLIGTAFGDVGGFLQMSDRGKRARLRRFFRRHGPDSLAGGLSDARGTRRWERANGPVCND